MIVSLFIQLFFDNKTFFKSFDLEETKYSPDEVSLDSFLEDVAQTSSVSDDITSLDEVLESKLQNIMSLDDLMPVNQLQLVIS